jgi:transmembrane sensor
MSSESEWSVIEEKAAQWLIERDRGLTPVRDAELKDWLQADARHAVAFDALDATWELMGEMQRATGQPAPSLDRRRIAWLPVSLAAAAALAIAWLGWDAARPKPADESAHFDLTAATEVGAQRQLNLPDGSVVQLNTDSAVEVHFQPAQRQVRLVRGEAHFTVARNQNRPFVVNAGGLDVRVVGTVFNVRLKSESVDVLVTEGKVRLAPATESWTGEAASSPIASPSELTAGQKVSIDRAASAVAPTAPMEVSSVEIRQTLAWQVRRLEFDATPLPEIVAEFNRYNRHKLAISDERLNGKRFGGSFPAADYETFVRMLDADFGIVSERKGETTFLRLKAE